MSWIQTINYKDANPSLKKIYNRVKGPDDNIDNVLLSHSLRPHTLIGHMTLYKSVLHSTKNVIPKWYLEAIGVYVSYLNQCDYCFEHHLHGFSRIVDDQEKTNIYKLAVINDKPAACFEGKYKYGFTYAHKLTKHPTEIQEADVTYLKTNGYDDGEILEINQVISYFNYVNRMVVGLGVVTIGDILGLSPNESDDPENWSHA